MRVAGSALEADGIAVVFGAGRDKAAALRVGRLAVPAGALVALTGPSGSGKTTLLNVLAGILPPTSGRVAWADIDVAKLGESRRDAWRRRNVGLIFQDFHLIEQLTPLANVILPASFSAFRTPPAIRARAQKMLEDLGVPLARRSVAELSRGERQRVAIARALLFDPPILLADEPTASLDEAAAAEVTRQIAESAAAGRTTIVVSHDRMVVERCDRVIRLEHGVVVSDTLAGARKVAEMVP